MLFFNCLLAFFGEEGGDDDAASSSRVDKYTMLRLMLGLMGP